MTHPSPYGRPPRDRFRVDRRLVGDHGPRPGRAPHWSRTQPPPPFRPCPDAELDRELLGLFVAAGRRTFAEVFEGLRPKWAVAAYARCLDRGYLREGGPDGRASVTPAGWAELGGGRGQAV